jgi:uncharacterized protein YydD (DUF2326 family)
VKLETLEIIIDGNVTRMVTFKNGLNLVTNKKDTGRSGNSVGKSTLSRVIDYLFLGSISPIYIDEEFKKPNKEIEALFTKHIVHASLVFISYDNKHHNITRNLCINDDEHFYVDGESIDKTSYERDILYYFFDVHTRRPSVRAIAPKFIRNDSHRMLHTTKFLDRHSSNKDYSELFLYLFGFNATELLTQKRDAVNLVSRRKKNKASLNSIIKEQKTKSHAQQKKVELKHIENKLSENDYSPKYENPVSILHTLQDKEDGISNRLLKIELQIDNIVKTVENLSTKGSNYLCNELKAIYEYANVSIDRVITDYEQVLSFHDNLVFRKKQFLENDLPDLYTIQEELHQDIKNVHYEKQDVFSAIRSREGIERLNKHLQIFSDLRTTIEKLDSLLEQQEKTETDYKSALDNLDEILTTISNETENIIVFEKSFVANFKIFTKKTHNEQYKFSLNYNPQSGFCNIDINNHASNPEGGKKKAEIISFDFAYIDTVKELKINRPTFVFHDSIEDIDQKQIKTIFQLSEKLEGQQIISMLSDKLTQDMYEEYIDDAILVLSEDDMFFKVQP